MYPVPHELYPYDAVCSAVGAFNCIQCGAMSLPAVHAHYIQP